MTRIVNAPSLANCDLLTLASDVEQLVDGGVDLVHVDVMDGHYVPNLCFPVSAVADLTRRHPEVRVDAHLMVDDPGAYVERLAAAGAHYVSFHADSTRFVRRTLAAYQAAGMKAGVAINPSHPVDIIEPYMKDLDYVVLMTVEPGFAGQRFLAGSLERLEQLDDLRTRSGADFEIEIDGGIDHEYGAECVRRGATILVTGIYAVFQQPDGIAPAVRRFDAAMAAAAAVRADADEARRVARR
ncbi:ribulose-phosphate 3-epimerase [Pseudactinotalea sp.]|uniref:ribulose-phosphate 3-epimerase n=1 Tax=Pseudactinotalea sp. TaxID=1926260 RepID=UPI003B3B26A4